jgi:hypothetical protein
MNIGVNLGRRLLALAALLAAVSGPVAAQGDSAAGRFIAVTGEVKVLGRDGVTRTAERNGELRPGDSIVTGADSLAQLRMSDGGAVSVRAETQLKLEGYRFLGPEDRESSFAVSILKGGFRMITGLIARNSRQNYRVSTSSMTLGVRGTHFEVVHVLQPVSDAAPGTYNRVYDGAIAVQSRVGASVIVSPGQTAFVALPSNLPPVLVAPPVALFGKPTPVPQPAPQPRGEGKAEGGAPGAAHKDKATAGARGVAPAGVAPSRTLSAPLLNPIDTPRVVETAPAPSTLSPTLISPTISPTLTSPTLTSPTTTTISPTTTTISPTTTTISPTLISPTTTTISPTLISPTTTTISPTLTAPTTTTISPTLISPTTTTISPTLTSPTTTTISPTLTSPTLTSPTTTTIKR